MLLRILMQVCLALLVSVLLSCKRDERTGSVSNEVAIALGNDMESMNPLRTNDLETARVHCEVWEPLNQLHPQTHRLMPVLASLPTISEDHLRYTYELNPQACFSDGMPVTAADVIFTFKTIKNPEALAHVKRSVYAELDSIVELSPSIVTMYFSKPKLNRELHVIDVSILPKHRFDTASLCDRISWHDLQDAEPSPLVRKAGAAFANLAQTVSSGHYIGSGPYVFAEWTPGQFIKLRRNQKYWAAKLPGRESLPDRLTYKIILDPTSALQSLKSKEIDILGLTPKQFADLDTSRWPFIKKTAFRQVACQFIVWNTLHPILRSKKIRKAFTMLIDRNEIIRVVMSSLGLPSESIIHPLQFGFDSTVRQPPYDPVSAKQLFAEDGWSDSDGDGVLDKEVGGKRVPLQFGFLTTPNERAVALIIEESMRKAGVKMDILQLDYLASGKQIQSRTFDAAIIGWAGNPIEPPLFKWFHSSSAASGQNYGSYASPEADRILEAINTEWDAQRRRTLLQQFQQLLSKDQPVTFLPEPLGAIAWIDRFDSIRLKVTQPCALDPRFMQVKGVRKQS